YYYFTTRYNTSHRRATHRQHDLWFITDCDLHNNCCLIDRNFIYRRHVYFIGNRFSRRGSNSTSNVIEPNLHVICSDWKPSSWWSPIWDRYYGSIFRDVYCRFRSCRFIRIDDEFQSVRKTKGERRTRTEGNNVAKHESRYWLFKNQTGPHDHDLDLVNRELSIRCI